MLTTSINTTITIITATTIITFKITTTITTQHDQPVQVEHLGPKASDPGSNCASLEESKIVQTSCQKNLLVKHDIIELLKPYKNLSNLT